MLGLPVVGSRSSSSRSSSSDGLSAAALGLPSREGGLLEQVALALGRLRGCGGLVDWWEVLGLEFGCLCRWRRGNDRRGRALIQQV